LSEASETVILGPSREKRRGEEKVEYYVCLVIINLEEGAWGAICMHHASCSL
jgi:hypothetical protein